MSIRPTACAANHCNEDFPVLSFTYALYCDAKFSELEHAAWKASLGGASPAAAGWDANLLGSPAVYRGYLDYYTRNIRRVFPRAASELIAVGVPLAKVTDSNNLYGPTPEQAREFVTNYLLPELTGQPPGDGDPPRLHPLPPPPRKAVANPERPLLSCLALIFMNGDADFKVTPASFLEQHELSCDERTALAAFAVSDRKFLTAHEASRLGPGLERELLKRPFVW